MPATRWGIASAGKISHDFVAALRSLPAEEHTVIAVAARELSRAQDFAKLHEIERAYDDYAKLAQDDDIGKCIHTFISMTIRMNIIQSYIFCIFFLVLAF